MKSNILIFTSQPAHPIVTAIKAASASLFDSQTLNDASMLWTAPWESTTRLLVLHDPRGMSNANSISPIRKQYLTGRVKRFVEENDGACVSCGSNWSGLLDLSKIRHGTIDGVQGVLNCLKAAGVVSLDTVEISLSCNWPPSITPNWYLVAPLAGAVTQFRSLIARAFKIEDKWPVEINMMGARATFDTSERRSTTQSQTDLPHIVVSSGTAHCKGSFNALEYLSHLCETQLLGSSLLYAPVCNSTQTFLQDNFNLLNCWPSGLVMIADDQLSGRGRGDNRWISADGCLQFTLLSKYIGEPRLMHFVQYLMAMAVVKAVRREHTFNGETVSLKDVPLHIKWPNDLYADMSNNRSLSVSQKVQDGTMVKLGGILINTTMVGGQYMLIIGVGLNVQNTKPTVSLADFLEYHIPNSSIKRYFTREYMLACILYEFELLYTTFTKQGFGSLEEEYYRLWLHTNQVVRVQSDEQNKELAEFPARITGLTNDGYLMAQRQDSPYSVHELLPDGNRFDMIQQLIAKRFTKI